MLPNPYNDLLVISITDQYQVHEAKSMFADLRASHPVIGSSASAPVGVLPGSPADLQLGRPTPGFGNDMCFGEAASLGNSESVDVFRRCFAFQAEHQCNAVGYTFKL